MLNRYVTRCTGVVMSIIIFTSGCGNIGEEAGKQIQQRQVNLMNLNSNRVPRDINSDVIGNQGQALLQVINVEGVEYVSLEELTHVLEYNSQLALKEKVFHLKRSSKIIEGEIYTPKDKVIKTFAEDMSYEFRDDQLIIYPFDDPKTNRNN